MITGHPMKLIHLQTTHQPSEIPISSPVSTVPPPSFPYGSSPSSPSCTCRCSSRLTPLLAFSALSLLQWQPSQNYNVAVRRHITYVHDVNSSSNFCALDSISCSLDNCVSACFLRPYYSNSFSLSDSTFLKEDLNLLAACTSFILKFTWQIITENLYNNRKNSDMTSVSLFQYVSEVLKMEVHYGPVEENPSDVG